MFTLTATTTQATVSVSAEIIEPISAFASEEIPPFCSADVNLYDIHFTDGSNSKNTKDEFMTTRVGTRLEGFKRRREEPSDEQQARDIDDVDIVPNFASILIPSTTQAPAQSSVATKKKAESDSDDSNSDDDDKEKVDFEGSDNDGDADDGAGDAALLWSLQRNNQSLPRPPM
ncbi:hypothetical protein E3N88_38079 [Mikania micrantha]|uniref:Uncharacterized protein n=1 Tax=Mikania micrantha TaxID=192012 RepID=A0A5N6LVF3_9ASTR|nr:hypothetical protein E3N88_38079 [Mikania micrantha]